MKKITQREVDLETVGMMLPCPFCGAIPEAEPWHGGGWRQTIISCQNNELCYVHPMLTGETPKQAIARWNHRAVNDLPINRKMMRGEEYAFDAVCLAITVDFKVVFLREKDSKDKARGHTFSSIYWLREPSREWREVLLPHLLPNARLPKMEDL